MIARVKSLLLENSGQGLIEYSLILLFITVAAIAVLHALGDKVLKLYSLMTNKWPGYD
jgi:Flp pilus assembly pilin Flp